MSRKCMNILLAILLLFMTAACSPENPSSTELSADVRISITESLDDAVKVIGYDGSETGGIKDINGYVIDFKNTESGIELHSGLIERNASNGIYMISDVPFGTYDIRVNAVMGYTGSDNKETLKAIGYGTASGVTVEEDMTESIAVSVNTWEVTAAKPVIQMTFDFPDYVFDHPIDSAYSLMLYIDNSSSPFFHTTSFFPEDIEEINTAGEFTMTRDGNDFLADISVGNHTLKAEIRSNNNSIVYKGVEAIRLIPDADNGGFFPVKGTIRMALSSESMDYEAPESYTITIAADTGLNYDLHFEQTAIEVNEGNDARIFMRDGLVAKDADIRFYVDGIDITDTFETEYVEQDGEFGTRYIVPREMLVLGDHIFKTIIKTEGFYGIMSIEIPLRVI